MDLSYKYVYPGTNILVNKLGIQDFERLRRAERIMVSYRVEQMARKGVTGKFDAGHLSGIH